MVVEDETFRYPNCTLEYDEDGVYLRISLNDGELTKEEEINILNFIRRKKIMNIDSEAVFCAMYSYSGNRVRIADPQEEVILDQELEVRVTNGGMTAIAKLLPDDGGKKLTIEKAISILNNNGIVSGIDRVAIEKMLNQEEYFRDIPVAYGRYPQNGEDAKLHYHIDLNRKAKPEILEDGSVDYRNLDLIQNVKKGQLLVSLTPPTEGIPGETVTGKTIAARSGRNLLLPRGKNVLLAEDGLSLLAGIDGRVEIIDGKIHIYAVYEVSGNVDNSTGNIDFVGNVIIHGNVLTGFEVKSGGYIEVRGVVEGAKLFATGDVVLKQGMQGMGRGFIQSQGNVIARFIENGTVLAKGDVQAEAILHSNINCGGKIDVRGKKGLIAGGTISAGVDISAIVIGAPMATTTDLQVGINPLLREEYARLVKEMEGIVQELKKADQILDLLYKMEEAKGRLPIDKSRMRLEAIKTKLIYNERIPPIKARIAELDQMFKGSSMGKVSVKNTIYPGVKITIGSSVLYIKDEEQYVTFKREHGDVVRTTFLG